MLYPFLYDIIRVAAIFFVVSLLNSVGIADYLLYRVVGLYRSAAFYVAPPHPATGSTAVPSYTIPTSPFRRSRDD